MLVQEYVEGKPFSAREVWPQPERDRLGEIIFRFCFGCLYRHRLFNGDPHPGNYLLLDDGGVAFVDYGCVAEFSTETVEAFMVLIRALLAGDHEAWRSAHEAVGILRPGAPFTTADLTSTCTGTGRRSSPMRSRSRRSSPAKWSAATPRRPGWAADINRWCNVPEGMVFLTRINFGLAGLFAGLNATGPWRAIVEEYVAGRAPCTELGELSAKTSRGLPV